MISLEDWNARIDAFIAEENKNRGKTVPVHRIYCQDDSDRSGGGIYNETVTVDTIGRFARALGDSNPLYSDPRYRAGQAGTACQGLFPAPPLLECCICSTFIGGRMPRLRGISAFDAGSRWERFLPILPGDSFSAQTTFLGVREITRKSGGQTGAARLLLREHRIDLTNHRGEHVSSLTARCMIRCAAPLNEDPAAQMAPDCISRRTLAEDSQESCREPSPENPQGSCRESSPADLRGLSQVLSQQPVQPVQNSRPRYREEELDRVYANLDAQLSGAFRRGSRPRYWEDVEIGEVVPEQIIGPYDESDGQALMAAIGAANAFATKWGSIRFRKGQGVTDPETGAHRHPIDRHSSDLIARAQGHPRALVSGIHSQALLAKSISDWMGDDGRLRTLDCRCLKPLYYGDLSLQRGRVTGRFEQDGRCFVNLHMEAVRQDGTVHTTAEAVVELPSRRTCQPS